ncbi:hypothetical protein [Alicyclobacillus acidocaldarius]|uniref:hypothetical protein n=1 Tax=Alicyclobacillus acidocaldarius TaxID=405212 RepID=UPI0002DF260C|nr:hypothetical protein [Alicyclobacillus acidocaldarius]
MNPPFLLQNYVYQLQNAFFQAFYHTARAHWEWYALVALILFAMECVHMWVRRRSEPHWWTSVQWIILTSVMIGFVIDWMSQIAQRMLI